MSPVWQADSLPLSHLGNPCIMPEASSKPALELSAKSPEILGLVYREESGRDSEERNLKGLLHKCLFLAQSHFSNGIEFLEVTLTLFNDSSVDRC